MKDRIFTSIKTRLQDKGALKTLLTAAAYWLFLLVYYELLLHIVVFGAPDGRFAFVFGFSLVVACALAVILSFLPKKIQFIGMIVVTSLLLLVYGSQLVYNFVFGTLYSVSVMQHGGAAITSFWKETLLTMWENIHILLLLFIPFIVLTLLWKFRLKKDGRTNGVWRVALILLAVVAQIVSAQCLKIGGKDYFSNYYFYHSNNTTTEQAAERFGLLTAFRLDYMATGEDEQTPVDDDSYYIPETTPPASTPEDGEPDENLDEQKPVNPYNVLEIDFDTLNELTTDKKIIEINNYCASLTGTKKNEYTGMLSDYNLIVLCAESFATGAIHKELTPTLYRLANEGIIFNNYYNTYPNNTTDGEYTLCMGLYPDTTRGKSLSSFYASRNSYLPFCLGNIFKEQRGIQAYGYHNYYGSYYGRDESHPNMGYAMKFASAGMKFTSSWPASDLEMMQQSVDDYISKDQQFHAYYMTFSGHYKYDRSVNPMAARNWDMVADLDYSHAAKAYLSCHIELDRALEYLMQRLEEEGIADKTAIVLAGDHFPYGLYESQYEELVGHEIDKFNKYKSTLIFWVGGLKENIIVDEYCCNVDVLPTILNLWGFEFDSRMLAGTDVFSDGHHMAVLRDMSFYTDKMWMHASSGEIRYLVDESEIPEGYVDNMIKLIKTKRSLSSDMLNKAYFNFVFELGKVAVNREGWFTPPETETEAPEVPSEMSEPPSESIEEPTEAPTQPTESSKEPTQAPTEPPEPTEDTEPTEPSTEPSEDTQAPTEGNDEPTEGEEDSSTPQEEPDEPTEAPVDPGE